MPDLDVTLPSYAQQERIATALNIIALKENQEAAATLEAMTLNGAMSSEKTLDTACQELIDGTNTTRIFWAWYPRAMTLGETNKYKLLSRFLTAAAQAWKDKTYTLRSYDPSVSGVTKMTPMDDLANKEAAQLCTENTEAVEDWADEDPTTWYIRANALSLEDGTMNITFFEGEDGFDITGEDAPVYTFTAALWIREWNDGSYDYISFRTTKGAGYYPDAADVDPENKKRAVTWHPSFPGGLNSKGALTSGAGRKAYNFASATTGIKKARQMTPYEGLWNDCDTRWLLRMWQLRHFDLENSRKENTIRDPLRNIYGRFRYWLGIRKGRTESDESIGQVVEKESTVADKRNDRNYQDATCRGRKATKKLVKTRTTWRSDAGHGGIQDQ